MITKYPIKASDIDVSCMQKYLTEDIADIANRAYEQGRADAIEECINKLCFSKIMSYRSEDIRRILEQLKEKQNEPKTML